MLLYQHSPVLPLFEWQSLHWTSQAHLIEIFMLNTPLVSPGINIHF